MDWQKALEMAERISKILAIIAAGIWAYYHYFRGRIYKPRLELKVSGRLTPRKGGRYLLATVQIKNVGLSKVELKQRGTGLRIISIEEHVKEAKENGLKEKRLKTFPVFEHHKWIESGERITDQRFFGIPEGERIGLKLELRAVVGGIAWRDTKIIGLDAHSSLAGET